MGRNFRQNQTRGGGQAFKPAGTTTGGPVGMSADKSGVRIKCASNHWKLRSEFSEKQLKRYDTDVKKGFANPGDTGIRCKACAAEANKPQSEQMIMCEFCDVEKPRSMFSSTTIKTRVYRCYACNEYNVNAHEGVDFVRPDEQPTTEERLAIRSAPAITRHAADDALVMNHDFGFVQSNEHANLGAPASLGLNGLGRLPGFAMDFSTLPMQSLPKDNAILRAQIGIVPRFGNDAILRAQTGNAPKFGKGKFGKGKFRSGKTNSWEGYNSWFKGQGRRDWDADETPTRPGGWVREPSRKMIPQVPEYLRD
ncbi:hypothetical protein B0H67DRAFT_649330 [Lasiosphaeris hirsuta]|uniref:Stc1 domain-containing protein n=1 Tax=Lasiosphaeris hirsuta TaxID=260670 RepID=A0AA39ZWQ1_9PEZI|nr:hypothetical protein B0H67DRAFT_649330 [Lasiosphaeris hirsuta]